jgi:hypothetical protein
LIIFVIEFVDVFLFQQGGLCAGLVEILRLARRGLP